MKKDIDIATTDETAKPLPNFFKVCMPITPAKKKSPKPKDMKSVPHSLTIAGKVGNEISTGSLRPDTCLAAETIVPVNKTSIISIAVRRQTKMSNVFHVNKLPR